MTDHIVASSSDVRRYRDAGRLIRIITRVGKQYLIEVCTYKF